jgi:hypothetical protein
MPPHEIIHGLVPDGSRNKIVVKIEDQILDQVGMKRLVIVRLNPFKEMFIPIEPADIFQKDSSTFSGSRADGWFRVSICRKWF